MPPEPSAEPKAEPLPPLRSVHTTNFPEILDRLGISVLVTTYQAGKLVMLRADRRLPQHALPRLQQADGPGRRSRHGATAGHRHGGGDLGVPQRRRPSPAAWSRPASTTPASAALRPCAPATSRFTRWPGPATSSGLRQHALFLPVHHRRDVQLRAALAAAVHLGAGPRGPLPPQRPGPGGRASRATSPPWAPPTRPAAGGPNKKDGGVLMDVRSGEVIMRGLSMPHSPRWYDGRLWLLESGTGGVGWSIRRAGPLRGDRGVARLHARPRLLRPTGLHRPVAGARVGGFQRHPPSPSALKERTCGVWVVDIQTGQTVAFLKFEDAVQEIFAVQVLPGVRYPDADQRQPPMIADSFVLPDEALQDVPDPLRALA